VQAFPDLERRGKSPAQIAGIDDLDVPESGGVTVQVERGRERRAARRDSAPPDRAANDIGFRVCFRAE